MKEEWKVQGPQEQLEELSPQSSRRHPQDTVPWTRDLGSIPSPATHWPRSHTQVSRPLSLSFPSTTWGPLSPIATPAGWHESLTSPCLLPLLELAPFLPEDAIPVTRLAPGKGIRSL
jgi:hypothetical protein